MPLAHYDVKLNISKSYDRNKFEISKLIHLLVSNTLPLQFSLFFYSHKSDIQANNETGIIGTWFALHDDKTVLNIRESKYETWSQKACKNSRLTILNKHIKGICYLLTIKK